MTLSCSISVLFNLVLSVSTHCLLPAAAPTHSLSASPPSVPFPIESHCRQKIVQMLLFREVCLQNPWHDLAFDRIMPAEPGPPVPVVRACFPTAVPTNSSSSGTGFYLGRSYRSCQNYSQVYTQYLKCLKRGYPENLLLAAWILSCLGLC